MTIEQLVEAIKASTKTITVCTPCTGVAGPDEWATRLLTYIDGRLLLTELATVDPVDPSKVDNLWQPELGSE
jgi:hypothetical protein